MLFRSVTSKTIIKKCANPGDLNCLNSGKTDIGPFSCPTGQKKDSKNNCICEDNNLVVNPDDKTKCIAKNTNTIIVYKEMMLYNLTRLNSSFWKVERSNAKNECY